MNIKSVVVYHWSSILLNGSTVFVSLCSNDLDCASSAVAVEGMTSLPSELCLAPARGRGRAIELMYSYLTGVCCDVTFRPGAAALACCWWC